MATTADDLDTLIQRLIGADPAVDLEILEAAWAGRDATLLVAAALLVDAPDGLLRRAGRSATTTRDRQLVAIATAYLSGADDRLDVLVRDHLSDHPGSLLAAWIATLPSRHHLGQPA